MSKQTTLNTAYESTWWAGRGDELSVPGKNLVVGSFCQVRRGCQQVLHGRSLIIKAVFSLNSEPGSSRNNSKSLNRWLIFSSLDDLFLGFQCAYFNALKKKKIPSLYCTK